MRLIKGCDRPCGVTGRVLPTEQLELCNRRVLGRGMQPTVDFCGSPADRDVCVLHWAVVSVQVKQETTELGEREEKHTRYDCKHPNPQHPHQDFL